MININMYIVNNICIEINNATKNVTIYCVDKTFFFDLFKHIVILMKINYIYNTFLRMLVLLRNDKR